MTQLDTNFFDYSILFIYFALVVAIGILARRAIATSEDFLLSGRSLTAWITGWHSSRPTLVRSRFSAWRRMARNTASRLSTFIG